MNATLKKAVITSEGGGSYTFYWACWSENVCIVKRHAFSYHSWKIKRSTESARLLWAQLVKECNARGSEPEIVTYDEGVRDSGLIKWVRMRLAD